MSRDDRCVKERRSPVPALGFINRLIVQCVSGLVDLVCFFIPREQSVRENGDYFDRALMDGRSIRWSFGPSVGRLVGRALDRLCAWPTSLLRRTERMKGRTMFASMHAAGSSRVRVTFLETEMEWHKIRTSIV